MRRRILAVTALFAVFVACRDGPAELVAPVEARTAPQTGVTASVDALRTVTEMLDDPFVRELVRGAGSQTELLYSALRDVSDHGMEEHVERLSQVLTATKSALFASGDDGEEDPDEAILGAALALVLDDAATLLEKPPLDPESQGRESRLVQN